MTQLVIAGPGQDRGEDLLATGSRPLAAAVDMVERRCHCRVTYEDPKWREDQVEELPGSVRPAPDAAKTLIPAGHPFMFIVRRDIASQSRAEITAALQQVLDAYDRTNDAGPFRIIAGATAWHVVPRSGSVLDARITFARGERSADETTRMILAAAQASNGEAVGVATAPINWMLQTKSVSEAAGERAGDVLARVLTTSAAKSSWRLLYDFSMRRYYLNIHPMK